MQRILIKLSGEALVNNNEVILSENILLPIIEEIKILIEANIEVAVVIGGGNICRGRDYKNSTIIRENADNIGILATIINGIALKNIFDKHELKSSLYSSKSIDGIVKPYIYNEVMQDLSDKKVVIFAGGTGNPYFSTDSTAALRAIQINADLLIKLTKVDGVYDSDPIRNPNAKRYSCVSYTEAMYKNLRILDRTAFALCSDNDIDILVCNNLKNVLKYHRWYLLDCPIIDNLEKFDYGTIVTHEWDEIAAVKDGETVTAYYEE